MCDQDHFEQDRLKYERRGLVTRREFGTLLGGAGVAFLLPAVANAAEVTESEVTIMTPDGMADAYFVHPTSSVCVPQRGRWASGSRSRVIRCWS